jgi:hypothetical protein
MSSSGTNKQPLLVDAPLHESVVLGPVAGLLSAGNLASINPAGLQALVPATSEGAIVDSISVLNNEANTTTTSLVVFLSTESNAIAVTPANTQAVAFAELNTTLVGTRTNVSLPPLLVPIPHLGAMASPTAQDKKNTGLLIPKGKTLFVGLTTRILLPSPTTTVCVFAQGGYY